MRIYLGGAVEAAALLISTAHSSSSALDDTSCESVSPLAISQVCRSSLMLQHIHRDIFTGHGTSWVARFWITCLHQRDIFRLPDPEKIMCPWAMGHEQCWHFRTVGTNPCRPLASCPWDIQVHMRFWFLYPSNSSLPSKVPAAQCTALDPYRLCQIAPLSCR